VRRLLPGIAAFSAAILVALLGLYARAEAPSDSPRASTGSVRLRLLGVNDFHGHLEPPKPGLGGAAWLKSHLDRAEIPGRTIRVHAGDMVGASPLISGWFHDEPSIEAANEIGFDLGTLGNHEFDAGGDELLRLLKGGQRQGPAAHKRDLDGRPINTSSSTFGGAAFPYIAANTYDRAGELLLPPFRIEERAGVRVGFIGVTTTSTPQFLLSRHASRLRFQDISDSVNRWVPELQSRGVEAIVVLAHSGGATPPGIDPSRAAGEIVDEARQMSDAVDVVIAGHTHSSLNLRVGDKLLVEARSYGTAYDRVDMTIDRGSGEVVAKSAEVPATTHAETAPDPDVAALVDRYAKRVGPLAHQVVGEARRPLTRMGGELGALVARAQRYAARADLAVASFGSLHGEIDAGPITYAEVAEAQGYNHRLMRARMRGADVLALMEEESNLYLSRPPGRPIEPDRTYTVAANELLIDRSPLMRRRAREARPVSTEIDALAGYLARRAAAS